MKINIIVAMCKNRGIGKDNDLVWKISSDMKKFKTLTTGNNNNAIIMGKNTYNSIKTTLKNRDIYILSKNLNIDKNVNNNIIKSFNSYVNLMNYLKDTNYDNIWVVGGESVYKIFLDNNIVDYIYITYINSLYTCDTFFPIIDINNYKFISKEIHNTDSTSNIYDIIYKNINININYSIS